MDRDCFELPLVDLVYFDAFSPEKQPELWERSVFESLYSAMNLGGILVTYCAKGYVRRTLVDVGFQVERIPGPPGKREILRAKK
jgi:tRNA U34 5-methylaminomethyl-2-thiouridine-forming methyltransferase MnmC